MKHIFFTILSLSISFSTFAQHNHQGHVDHNDHKKHGEYETKEFKIKQSVQYSFYNDFRGNRFTL